MESEGQSNSNQTESQVHHEQFWDRQLENIQRMQHHDFRKAQELPLARIKKIMKLDEDVKMISAEAPILFAKAAEIFITELSLRAWLHTEENKRRTLQRNDIAMAITKYDQFDFLIDIVPRDELKPPKRSDGPMQQTSIPADQVQYYFSMANNQTPTAAATATNTIQVQSPAPVSTTTTSQQQVSQAGQQVTSQPQLQFITVGGSQGGSTSQQQLLQSLQQIQTGADGQTTLISPQGQVVPIQLPAGTNLQQVVANASGDNQQIQFGNQIQLFRQGGGNNQTAGQEFITQISGGQIFQIQQVPTQAQAGTNLGQQVFLQQALPDAVVTSSEQQ